MNIKDLTLPQKIIAAILILGVLGLVYSVISASLPEEDIVIHDVDAVELYSNYNDYVGEYVRFAAYYDTVIPEHNAITITEGLNDYRKCIYAWMEEGNLPTQKKDYSSDYVLIVGKVKDQALGNLNIIKCRLEAVGDEAHEFYKAHKNKESTEVKNGGQIFTVTAHS